jgi:flavin-dependent thymidylate synthase
VEIILSGYNIDLDGLKEDNNVLTPETFSAAYARLSRSPKLIPQLRSIARHEISKAREQNRRIIYEMGHHSIAEHSVFNFDIIGISRLAVESIESHRLMSYTEASQRYIKWATNYVTPSEIKKTKLEPLFHNTIQEQLKAYAVFAERLKSYETKFAKPIEDARYVTSLAMTTQLGMTCNARNLELVIRRFASSDVDELQTIGKKLYQRAVKVAPSVILFVEKNKFDSETYKDFIKFNHRDTETQRKNQASKLVDYTENGDEKLIASIICKVRSCSYESALHRVKKMPDKQQLEYIKTAFKHAQLYDTVLREFEHCYLTYELVVSASSFAQLKRHRLATITTQAYNPDLGVTIPHTIRESKQTRLFNRVIEKTEKTYYKIYKQMPQIAPYILTQAHRRRILLTINVRELYHIARLRMDATAQWDIRELTVKMVKQAQKVMPISLAFCCAKDQYNTIYKKYFIHSKGE